VKHYIENYQLRLNELWAESPASPQSSTAQSAYNKLINYFSLWINDPLTSCGWADTCLVVKLAAEVSDLSEDMRSIMAHGVENLIARVSELIQAGKIDRSISIQGDTFANAQVIYQM
ncbi:TetR/AcrR family transcriptional regulator, partial [Rhizobium hidalgonense]|nr:TetR/AcrR family transcriptional regulator [Rhizobium hidalgonense]